MEKKCHRKGVLTCLEMCAECKEKWKATFWYGVRKSGLRKFMGSKK